MNYIYGILKENKYSLILIYFYMLLAQLLYLVEPYILGKAIDGLIKKEYYWLWCFLIIELLANVFMYKRMVFDTKVYTKIYNDIVLNYLKNDNKSDTSTKVARTEMANNLINFFEHDMHYYIMAIVTISGSLFFIFLENINTGFVVLTCVIPISLIVYRFYNKIEQSTRVGNTQFEEKFAIIDTNDENRIDTFFKRRKRILISGSTIQGKNWASLNVTKTIFLISALIIFTSYNSNLTQGDAIAMYAYINQFLISLMSIPIGVEIFTRIKDVTKRINEFN
jgi:ABC-type multidrug transport system fused ATPase/permease subunit